MNTTRTNQIEAAGDGTVGTVSTPNGWKEHSGRLG